MPEVTSFGGTLPYAAKHPQKMTARQPHQANSPHFSGGNAQTGESRDIIQIAGPVNGKKRKTAPSMQASPFTASGPKKAGGSDLQRMPAKKPKTTPPEADSDTEPDEPDSMVFTFDDPSMMNALPFFLMGGAPPKAPGNRAFSSIKDNIGPLSEEDPELDAYKEAGAPYAERLSEISSRAYLNNAVLKADNPQLKKGILMKLKERLGQKPVFSVDCSPEKTANLKGSAQGKALAQAFAEPADKMGLPAEEPTVLVLNNAHPAEVDNLTRKETFQRIREQNPHFRFIVAGQDGAAQESGDSGKLAMLKSLLGGGKEESASAPTAPFEVVQVPPINARQWSGIITQDKQARQILRHWKMDMPHDTLKEFLETLQRQNQTQPTRDQILAELDSLGSFIRVRKQDNSSQITRQHLGQYAREVLNPKTRKKDSPDQNPAAAMMPKPYTIVNSGEIKTRLEDVVGHEDAKSVLQQALESVKYPALSAYLDEGDEDAPNNNVLLLGEPGGGKTMLAKAIAGQGGGTFISSSGSQFVNMIVGMGANNMRRLKAAIEDAPDDLVVVFIDEIDSLGSRDGAMGSGAKDLNGMAANREETQTINEFLAITEGVNQSNKKVLLIGATNRPHALDEGILSRFHHKIEIKKLNEPQRKELLSKQLEQKKLTPDDSVDLETMARQTEGLSGRDIRNLMKLAKQELVKRIPIAEKERLEHDAEARSRFRLQLNQDVLMKALEQVKEGWKNAKQQHAEKPVPFGMYA